MSDVAGHAERVSEACVAAVAASAVGDAMEVDRLIGELLAMAPAGKALLLAATGWGSVVAQHVVGDGPGGRFTAQIDEPDDACEVFAAVVCAIGNGDDCGALDLLSDSDPKVAFSACLHLLVHAGEALAAINHHDPRHP